VGGGAAGAEREPMRRFTSLGFYTNPGRIITMFLLLVFLSWVFWLQDRPIRTAETPAIIACYDPTLPYPNRFETKNILIEISILDYSNIRYSVERRIKELERMGLFRWPIVLSDGSKAWHIDDLEQVRLQ